jgi:predicted ATPase
MLARKLPHPFSLLFTTFVAVAWVHEHRGEAQITEQILEGVSTLTVERERSSWQVRRMLLRGLLLVDQERPTEALELAEKAVALDPSRKSREQSHTDVLLAQLYGKTGQTETALAVLKRALARAQESGEHWYEAELHRISGELLLSQGSHLEEPAAACFHEALRVSRKQTAKSLELRAAMSLGRLWQKQGKKKAARQLLGEVYSWFSEGFDTADLKEAKALLEQLS